MKIIYDNELQGYIIAFEDIDSPILVDADDIVEARDCLVKHIVSEFNSAIQERLTDDGADEQYDDWCFDCDHCNSGFCTCNSICVDGELWAPKDFEDYLD